MNMALKYENKFKIGDTIKALDFAGDSEYYIAGEIIGTSTRNGAKMFDIKITTDTLSSRIGETRVGDIGFVPMECMLGDRVSEDRITLYGGDKSFKEQALELNPNLKMTRQLLDQDWGLLKKGFIYSVHDTVTGRQVHELRNSEEEAWEFVATFDDGTYPEALSKP